MAVAAALFAEGPRAQRVVPEGPPNFDIRTQKDVAAAAYVGRVRGGATRSALPARASARAQGLTRLRAQFSSLDVIESETLGTPEVVSVKPGTGFLTGPSANRVNTMRTFLATHADAFGLSRTQVASLELVSDYMNPAGNMGWVEFEQKINGIPVFQGLIRGGFTAQGELARTTGLLAADLEDANLATVAGLRATEAVARAAENVGLAQTMARDPKAWPVYFPMGPGLARLAWATEIWGDPNVFLIVLDAEDGTVLFRKNLTSYQSQAATYHVYTSDSPAPLSPTTVLPGPGTQAPYGSRTSVNLIGNEGANVFNDLGWMTDNVNGGNGWTEGNNVRAGVDLSAPDGIDALTSGVARVFNFAYDPSADAPTTANYRNGEVTNQFYWSNVFHDKLYLLGFTEPARNFQHDNFGRGGLQADRVNAEAQDYSGDSNANFTSPPDGSFGRMQMYIFSGPTPDRSSGLDAEILLHELTHGASSRLHNNASGLLTTMSGGMGEGWSDFYARALLSSSDEDVNGIYAMGAWITNLAAPGFDDNYYYGIRRFPYAVKTNLGGNGNPHNPLTFADVDPDQATLSDGAFPPGAFGSFNPFQVHNIGEVWCMALLEVRARFITRLGFAVGNERILQFVTDAMKLDAASPTMLQGRDSILAAANAGGGTPDDIADIWAGFATRGMGLSAQVLNVNSGSVAEAFDVPGPTAGEGILLDESIPNGRIDPTEAVSVELCIFNNSLSPSGNISGTLQATGGVTSPSGPESYGVIPAGDTVCVEYSFINAVSCGGTITATLAITETGGASRNLVYSFQVGTPVFFYDDGFDSSTAPTLPPGWTTSTLSGLPNPWKTADDVPTDSAPNAALAENPDQVSDAVLVSPVVPMPLDPAVLTFRNWYATEAGFDGGVLEIKIGLGGWTDILDAGGSFVTGGYNDTIPDTFENPLGGRPAWSGSSGGYKTTTVNMPPSSAGEDVSLRWRLGTDEIIGASGWLIDSVSMRLAQFECGGASLPGPFAKTVPLDGATAQPLAPVLSWGSSSGADSYEYCIDTSDNDVCNAIWTSVGTATSVGLAPLSPSTTYSWHIRALNGSGPTYSDGSEPAFWTFTTGAASGPFGQIDSPTQNAAGVQGAIGITGWALDDIGVTDVKLYRNCLGGFDAVNCQMVAGQNVVFIGDASFVAGARPDVEAAYPTHPFKHRAGWGYLMLTLMLPHVTNSQPYGGQGPITIYAIATDANANKKILGRTTADSTPTSMTMANDTIAVPFGGIDTPAQGETINGVFNNFGWVLTPDSNTVGGEGVADILMPINGSTINVYIDGLPPVAVAYNQCRGTVGNPVPGGAFCDDDVANIFGNTTAQPPNTARASNPTKYRNLDVERGAIGAYTFNTTLLSEGVHTIQWGVADSQGRVAGLGSRYFTVDNSAASTVPSGQAQAQAQVLGDKRAVDNMAPVTEGVWGRTGFSLDAPWTKMHAQDDGTYAVRLTEMGRLELWLGPVDAGYMVANDTLRPLPVGSTLLESRFGWMPPPGYIGPYRLTFVRGGERIDVTVTVVEKPRVVEGEAQIRMGAPRAEVLTCSRATAEKCVRVHGSAFDPQAAIGSGIDAVHVWAQGAAAPVFLGAATLDRNEYSLNATLAPGSYTLTVYAWNARTARWEDARSVAVVVR